MSTSDRREHVKYLEDVGLNIYSKTDRRPAQKPPPKVRGKHFSNLEYLVDGSLVWLTPKNLKSFPSKTYDARIDSSYFEQCFITVNKLGEGSFGSVYKVICKDDKKFYAMKVSKEPFRNDWDRTSKVNEVDLHTLVSGHQNIATLYNAWEEDRHMYMQLELCKPVVDNEEPVSEYKCWEVLIDIVTALDCLHNLGMGHFDVKLENILCGYDGLYKLSDFGLVYHFEKDKQKVPKEGDAKYMAPELLNSAKEFTTKADIFSLGISILELAGNLSLPTNGEVWKALRDDTFPLTHTQRMSDDLFYLLTKMMSSDSSLRPSASDILQMPIVKAAIHKVREIREVRGKKTGLEIRGKSGNPVSSQGKVREFRRWSGKNIKSLYTNKLTAAAPSPSLQPTRRMKQAAEAARLVRPGRCERLAYQRLKLFPPQNAAFRQCVRSEFETREGAHRQLGTGLFVAQLLGEGHSLARRHCHCHCNHSELHPQCHQPLHKALRKMFGGIWMLKDVTHSSNDVLPYMTIWAVFSLLVILMARNLAKPSVVNSDSAMEVDDFTSPGNVSFSGFMMGKRQIREQSPISSFATSTPFAMPNGRNCKVPRLLNGSTSLGSREELSFTNDSYAETSSQVNTPCTMNRARNMADTTSGYISPCSSINFGQDLTSFNPSMMSFGVSPIRLSQRQKEAVKASKRQRMMVPRNLSKHFEDEDKDEEMN
ncbi:Protein kinase, membrane associated tyrosine threonine 1 [Homalodisca vitripennis]|nr:Protein kinase, membrane associated tyrosine threonine 1 [Homalodisca vitripennis]